MIRSDYLGTLFFFFFNDPATTEIYTLSLHDALPISGAVQTFDDGVAQELGVAEGVVDAELLDRKSTRLNSSHPSISYAVFCLKKKKKNWTCNFSIVRFSTSMLS